MASRELAQTVQRGSRTSAEPFSANPGTLIPLRLSGGAIEWVIVDDVQGYGPAPVRGSFVYFRDGTRLATDHACRKLLERLQAGGWVHNDSGGRRATTLPRHGTLRRKILDMLPATNAQIGEALEMHSGEVARTTAALRHAGLVRNAGRKGRGHVAFYVRAP